MKPFKVFTGVNNIHSVAAGIIHSPLSGGTHAAPAFSSSIKLPAYNKQRCRGDSLKSFIRFQETRKCVLPLNDILFSLVLCKWTSSQTEFTVKILSRWETDLVLSLTEIHADLCKSERLIVDFSSYLFCLPTNGKDPKIRFLSVSSVGKKICPGNH